MSYFFKHIALAEDTLAIVILKIHTLLEPILCH